MSTNSPPPIHKRQFASDNYSGICPEAWKAMEEANQGHASAYGEDDWTRRACDRLRDLFEIDCEVFFAFNGTAANSLATSAMCRSYHSVLCHELCHMITDECGAPAFFSNGTVLKSIPGKNGKMDPAAVEYAVNHRTDIHYPKPKVLSITQSTELGTVYTTEEIRELGELAGRLGLRFHMDGARFANAIASKGVHPAEFTWKAGVDVLCFGGTKNGMAVGEAIIFFDQDLAWEFDYRSKHTGQLASKMRFLAAPWCGILEDQVWIRHATHANNCAQKLATAIEQIDRLKVVMPCEANAVFVEMPQSWIDELYQLGWHFYSFIGEGHARLMCSWDTTDEDIEDFMRDVKKVSETIAV